MEGCVQEWDLLSVHVCDECGQRGKKREECGNCSVWTEKIVLPYVAHTQVFVIPFLGA